ncbi:hypothetical protein EZV62_000436 [Acer yangbiense]|uniref:Retrotransposon gag domain-containing protein n=1 Tax=Acer yangbiense TaxID=1000413 RepID=A0A5C7IR28_9ROSI|nr:hypothetical protein EZV62_000436 [Acer yangbiense]
MASETEEVPIPQTGSLVRSEIHRVLSDGEETIREIRRMTKAKKGNTQSNTRELIRENEELRDRIRNLTGKVTQPGLGQDHVASIPRLLLENGINSNGCAKERNQMVQNHHVERHSYSRERRGPHREEACHEDEELRNFDGNTRKEHIHVDKYREGHRRSEPQAPAESQHSSSRPRDERGQSRSTFRRHAENKRRTRQRTCKVEMNDSRHSRYLHDCLKRLEERILGMQRNQTDNHNPDPLVELQSPFVARIREAIAHRRFEMPQIPHYEGHSDPMTHMQLYRGLMEVRGPSEDVMCKFFPLTLGGTSLKWFNKLKPSSIQNFSQMCREFITRFRGARPLERKPNVLRDIKQGESETLKEYVERFHKEVINLGAYDEENTLEDFIRNIRICRLWFNFQDFRPKDYTEAYECALRFIETEEQLRLKKVTERAEYSSKKEKGKGREENQGDRNGRPMITGGIPRLQPRGHDQLKTPVLQPQPVMNVPNEMHPETFRRARTWNSKYANYHALNATREQILAALHETGLLTKPEPLRGDPSRRNQAKYCDFHGDIGHTTSECFHLKDHIETLIRNGYLKEFIDLTQEARQQVPDTTERDPPKHSDKGKVHMVHTIAGGPTLAGDSNRARKAYSRSTVASRACMQVNQFQTLKRQKIHTTPIIFTDEDSKGVTHPHDDALVVSLTIAGKVIPRILIDTGSSVDIMFKKTLDHLGIEKARLREVNTPLYGFTGDSIWPVGTIDIPITFGEDPDQFTAMITYVVVDAPGVYSVILGRPFLVATKAGVSLYHNVMKIPTVQMVEIPRSSNFRADTLARFASAVEAKLPRAIPIEILEKPSIQECLRIMEAEVEPSSWIDPIMKYLKNGEAPEDKNEKCYENTTSEGGPQAKYESRSLVEMLLSL